MFSYSLAGLEVDQSAEEVLEVEENETTARSAFYQLLAKAYRTPDQEAAAQARGGEIAKEFEAGAAELPFELPKAQAAPEVDLSDDDFSAEFIRLFEVAVGGPECPLFGGAYATDRMAAMEEVARFYDYFGLKTSSDANIPPDHICTELDFMQYLTFKEAATPSPRLGKSYQNAQKDFLARQLGDWVPKMAERLEAEGPNPWFSWIVGLTADFVAADAAYVEGLLG